MAITVFKQKRTNIEVYTLMHVKLVFEWKYACAHSIRITSLK